MTPRLHLVTSDEVLRDEGFVDSAERVIAAYGAAVAVHLRGHGLSGSVLHALAERLLEAASRSGAMLLVNDRVDVALACGAPGVQLGRRSLPVAEARRLLGADALIGYSAHAADEALDAGRESADFIVLGTIFPTASHPGEPARVGAVLEAGAYGVAVLGGVWHAADPVGAARRYLEVLEEGTK